MLAGSRILPANRWSDIMNRARRAPGLIHLLQPWAYLGILVGPRLKPYATGNQTSVFANRANPLQDIVPSQLLPAPIVVKTASVTVVQRPTTMPALKAFKINHVSLDP
jgi:hypothetical protein